MQSGAKSPASTPSGIHVEWLDDESVDAVLRHYFGRQWASKRKAEPLDQLLDRTQSWAARLPNDTKPDALMRRYPRIANQLAASWRDPVMLGHYLESLLVDRRGGRTGFPPDVLQELHALRSYYFLGVFPYGRGEKRGQRHV